jgi:hypothetical protein
MINPEWNNKNHYTYRHIKNYMEEDEEISELGIRTARVLDLWQGINHIEHKQKNKINWSANDLIKLAYHRPMSNFDDDDLSELFVYSSLAGLRITIQSCNFTHIYIEFRLNILTAHKNKTVQHPLFQVLEILETVKKLDDVEGERE